MCLPSLGILSKNPRPFFNPPVHTQRFLCQVPIPSAAKSQRTKAFLNLFLSLLQSLAQWKNKSGAYTLGTQKLIVE